MSKPVAGISEIDRAMDVELVEVGPRDGLQAESAVLDVAERVELVERLVAAGLQRVEVASFVHPRMVPQMAGAEEVVAGLSASTGASYIGLVLNERGLDRALTTAVHEVNFVVAAAAGYSRSNSGMSVEEAMESVERLVPRAKADGRRTSMTIAVAFGDPYDGEVAPAVVAGLAGRAAGAGIDEIALGDTIGVAVPSDVAPLVAAVRHAAPSVPLRCHFHDTRHAALGNVYAALQEGIRIFDTSVAGIGGSPFAPGTGGNVATEDLLFMLARMGVAPRIDAGAVVEIARRLSKRLGRDLPGAASRLDIWPPADAPGGLGGAGSSPAAQ